MQRALTIRNIYNVREEYLPLKGVLAKVFGDQPPCGVWLIYGAEKNGKTTFALKLANALSEIGRVLYVSAEQGTGVGFREIAVRAGIDIGNRNIHVIGEEPLDELDERLNRRRAANIVFIDNVMMYEDEFRHGRLAAFLKNHRSKLLIFLAHETKDGEPHNPAAKLCKKRANAIVRVRGMVAEVGGRGNAAGGSLIIDRPGAALVLGEQAVGDNLL